MNTVRGWLRKYPIASVVVALVVGGLIGYAGESVTSSELEDEVTSLEAELSDAQSDLEDAESDIAYAEEETERAEERLAGLGKKRRALARREAKLNRRAKSISKEESEAREAAEKSEIEDGIWKVGVDIEPGTYRAPAGPQCYWARLNSANTDDIANNGGFSANQTVTLDSGWFQTSDCGTWEKIE